MYYRIAEITLYSEVRLPSYEAFLCEETAPDATLKRSDEIPPRGRDLPAGDGRVRRTEDGWFFHYPEQEQAGLLVSEDYTRLWLTGGEGAEATVDEEWFVRFPLECLLARRGYISLHAACVELNGEALAFSGPSGTGKSTRARVWMEQFGAKLISGDRPLIRVKDPEVFGVPWDGKEQCFRNAHYPLRAVCDTRRSKSVRIRRMSFQQKRRLLLNQCFMPMWDTETAVIQMVNISRFAAGGEILRTFCGRKPEDAAVLKEWLDRREYLKEERDMKVKDGFILKNVVGDQIVMPTGENIAAFNGALLLNSVSAYVWEKLQNPVSREDLLAAVTDKFEVDEETAAKDLDALLEKLKGFGVIEDE